MSSRRLQDRVCVVTGAARGIGLAIAERFGQEGGRVACVDVSARRLEPAVEDLKSKGFEARAYGVDVGKRDSHANRSTYGMYSDRRRDVPEDSTACSPSPIAHAGPVQLTR